MSFEAQRRIADEGKDPHRPESGPSIGKPKILRYAQNDNALPANRRFFAQNDNALYRDDSN